jgi:hypothetical protein
MQKANLWDTTPVPRGNEPEEGNNLCMSSENPLSRACGITLLNTNGLTRTSPAHLLPALHY